MKQIHGWHLPDDDEHFEYHLKQGEQVEGRGTYQFEKIRKTLACVPIKNRQRVVDIGAHVGFWSWHFAKVFQHVDAFEPIPEMWECFRKNVSNANVKLHPYALSNTSSEMFLQKPDNSNSGNWATVFGTYENSTTIKAEALPLDSFRFQDVDLIKIDVEGWEIEVVRGAQETIERCKPVITVEQKPGHGARYGFDDRAAVKLLQHWGMRMLWERSGDICLGW